MKLKGGKTMNKKRILAMIMAVAMVLSMVAGMDFTVNADTDYYSGGSYSYYATTGDTYTLTAVAYKSDGTEWDLSSGYTFEWCPSDDENINNAKSKSITIAVGDWGHMFYWCNIYKNGEFVTSTSYYILNKDNYMQMHDEDEWIIVSTNETITLTAVAYDYTDNAIDLTNSIYTFDWYKETLIYDVYSDYYATYTSLGTTSTITITPTSQSDYYGYYDSNGQRYVYDSSNQDYSCYCCDIYKNGTYIQTYIVKIILSYMTDDNSANDSNDEDDDDEDDDFISTEATTGAAVGTTATVGNLKYKVTKAVSGSTAGEVTIASVAKKSKKVTIPDTVTISGATYKVTAIAAKAFKGNKKITSVVIGKNVKTIGANAFNGCKKLKTITIKGTSLKKVGKKAIKGIKSTAVIKVPKTKLKVYKKLFKKKTGFKKTMKIKKK